MASLESFPGLEEWLKKLKLLQYTDEVVEWCESAGASELDEIVENWEDLAEHLALKPLERKRIEKFVRKSILDGATDAFSGQRGTVDPAPEAGPDSAKVGEPAPDVADVQIGHSGAVETFGPPSEPDKYRMLEEIGHGATARVWKCAQKENLFAVKTISLKKLKRQPNWLKVHEMLYREISILLSLHHLRVVTLHEVVEEEDRLRLVMELVDGGDLCEYLAQRGGWLPELDARYVFVQMAQGLQYIHSKGIVHRDVKPDNVLVDSRASREGLLEVKLVDFGHSLAIGGTESNDRVGTPLYMAPEAWDPSRAEPANEHCVDLWSLGVVLYLMLVGDCPFGGVGYGGFPSLQAQILQAEVIFKEKGQPSEAARNLIRCLLKVDPQLRLPLDMCLTHPWIAAEGGFSFSEFLDLCSKSDPEVLEERFQMPEWQLSQEQARDLRRDLQKWTVEFRYAAMATGRELTVNYGEQATLDNDRVEKARQKLDDLMIWHFHEVLPLCECDLQRSNSYPEEDLDLHAGISASREEPGATGEQGGQEKFNPPPRMGAASPDAGVSSSAQGEPSGSNEQDDGEAVRSVFLGVVHDAAEQAELTQVVSAIEAFGKEGLAPVEALKVRGFLDRARQRLRARGKIADVMALRSKAGGGGAQRLEEALALASAAGLQDEHLAEAREALTKEAEIASSWAQLKEVLAAPDKTTEQVQAAISAGEAAGLSAGDLKAARSLGENFSCKAGDKDAAAAALAAALSGNDACRLALAMADARQLGVCASEIQPAEVVLKELPHEAEVKRRRLEARRSARDQTKWNFSGKSLHSRRGVDDRAREHEEHLEASRRNAFRARGRFKADASDEAETAQDKHVRRAKR